MRLICSMLEIELGHAARSAGKGAPARLTRDDDGSSRPRRARPGADRLRERDAGARRRCSTCSKRALAPLGFEVHRCHGRAARRPAENMVAIRGDRIAALRLCRPSRRRSRRARAGAAVRSQRRRQDGVLYGRGAVDMKSSIAALVAAAARRFRPKPARCRCSSPATRKARRSTAPAAHRLAQRAAIRPDLILVGEPTSVARLGDTVKIGRRGSVNMWLKCRASGPRRLSASRRQPDPEARGVIAELDALQLDEGTDGSRRRTSRSPAISTPTMRAT